MTTYEVHIVRLHTVAFGYSPGKQSTLVASPSSGVTSMSHYEVVMASTLVVRFIA